jgi:hypothetical protein
MFLSYLSNIFSLSKRKFLYCIVYLSLLLLFCFLKKKVGHCNSEDGKVESNVAKGRGKGKYQVKHRFFLYINPFFCLKYLLTYYCSPVYVHLIFGFVQKSVGLRDDDEVVTNVAKDGGKGELHI